MIFLTVGTLFPFDRLVQAVDIAVAEGIIRELVYAQIGKTVLKPKYIEYSEVLEKDEFNKKVNQAHYLISHAGIGSIATALECGKPLLVMPRLKRYREHVNDHQLATARRFEELGHVLVAYSEKELPEKLQQIESFIPKPRQNHAKAMVDKIAKFLEQVSRKKYHRNSWV